MQFKGPGPILAMIGIGNIPDHSKRVARDRKTEIRAQFLLAYGIKK
jgi:hypothetical protein